MCFDPEPRFACKGAMLFSSVINGGDAVYLPMQREYSFSFSSAINCSAIFSSALVFFSPSLLLFVRVNMVFITSVCGFVVTSL